MTTTASLDPCQICVCATRGAGPHPPPAHAGTGRAGRQAGQAMQQKSPRRRRAVTTAQPLPATARPHEPRKRNPNGFTNHQASGAHGGTRAPARRTAREPGWRVSGAVRWWGSDKGQKATGQRHKLRAAATPSAATGRGGVGEAQKAGTHDAPSRAPARPQGRGENHGVTLDCLSLVDDPKLKWTVNGTILISTEYLYVRFIVGYSRDII